MWLGSFVVAALALVGAPREVTTVLPADAQAVGAPVGSGADASIASTAQGQEIRIVAIGDSLFAGYRLGRRQGYPERLQSALRESGLNARVINSAVLGDTTASGLQRLKLVLGSLDRPPDLVIVELGHNDVVRGIPPGETRQNLAAIMAELQRQGVQVLLMGIRAPASMGAAYTRDFDSIYGTLAKQFDAHLVPFFEGPIHDKPQLLQPDHVHPTAQGVDVLVSATLDAVKAALRIARP